MDETSITNEFLTLIDRKCKKKKWTTNNENVCEINNHIKQLNFSSQIPVCVETTNKDVIESSIVSNVLKIQPNRNIVTKVESTNENSIHAEIKDNIMYLRPNQKQVVDACSWNKNVLDTSIIMNVLNLKPSEKLVTNVVCLSGDIHSWIENNTLYFRKNDDFK